MGECETRMSNALTVLIHFISFTRTFLFVHVLFLRLFVDSVHWEKFSSIIFLIIFTRLMAEHALGPVNIQMVCDVICNHNKVTSYTFSV